MSLLFFAQSVRLPGVSGASTEIRTGRGNLSTSALHVETILEYGDTFVVSSGGLLFHFPRTSVLGWSY